MDQLLKPTIRLIKCDTQTVSLKYNVLFSYNHAYIYTQNIYEEREGGWDSQLRRHFMERVF